MQDIEAACHDGELNMTGTTSLAASAPLLCVSRSNRQWQVADTAQQREHTCIWHERSSGSYKAKKVDYKHSVCS